MPIPHADAAVPVQPTIPDLMADAFQVTPAQGSTVTHSIRLADQPENILDRAALQANLGPQARVGARQPMRTVTPNGPVDPKVLFQQELKGPDGAKLNDALKHIKETGGTKEEKKLVQGALVKAGYQIDDKGRIPDKGVDGKVGALTSKALQAATGDSGFVNQLTPAYRAQHYQQPTHQQVHEQQGHGRPKRAVAPGPGNHR